MHAAPEIIVGFLWILFGFWWLISALWRKRTKKREGVGQRLVYVLPLLFAFWLIWRPEAERGWLAVQVFPRTDRLLWVGCALVAAGIGITLWARLYLGTNWSGAVTLKEGHELIASGPYRWIRHPIYTGLLLALLGSAIQRDQIRAYLAVAIAWASFYIKAKREESFLSTEFGERFAAQRQNTGMFLPKIT